MSKLYLILLTLLLASCCPDIKKNISNNEIQNKGNDGHFNKPVAVQVNQSIVTAELLEVYKNDNNRYVIKARILEIEENPSYPSIAVKGDTYNLFPNFQVDGGGNLPENSEKNADFFSLLKLPSGTKFKAEIAFENLNGWYINKIIH